LNRWVKSLQRTTFRYARSGWRIRDGAPAALYVCIGNPTELWYCGGEVYAA
jgi:hypothetical protein